MVFPCFDFESSKWDGNPRTLSHCISHCKSHFIDLWEQVSNMIPNAQALSSGGLQGETAGIGLTSCCLDVQLKGKALKRTEPWYESQKRPSRNPEWHSRLIAAMWDHKLMQSLQVSSASFAKCCLHKREPLFQQQLKSL